MSVSRGNGPVFWSTLFACDILTHGRKRDLKEIAEAAGISYSTVRSQVKAMRVPYPTNLWALAEEVGMSTELVRAVTTPGGRVILNVSEGTVEVEGAPDPEDHWTRR